jgi:hypothetical protein
LRFDGGARLEVDAEGPQFHCPFRNTSSGIPIVEYIPHWEINDDSYIVFVEVVAKLPGCDEYSVEKCLN